MTQEHQSRRRRRLTATITDLEVAVQRAFLVGVKLPGTTTLEEERSLDELALLTDTAGSDPVDQELVKRETIDAATFIGSGKAQELANLTQALDIDVVIFDQPLSPAQQRNLQKVFGCDVVDREAVILDIFAQHAHSKVGSLQVELALLNYMLPRLRGKGKALSQQAGGIGTRGPGETKLETDRRRITQRISKLERQLKESARHQETQRKQRRRNEVPQAAIVGYTNAGKSTLLNALTDAGALVEDRLFATLDSTVRRLELPNGDAVLLADTVGFVRRLPHGLVEAFRSTLSEASEADLLIHIVDGTDDDPEGQIAAVREVLAEIEAHEIPELVVINKVDAIDSTQEQRLRNLYPDAVFMSALKQVGLEDLLASLGESVASKTVMLSLAIPYENGDIAIRARQVGEVIEEKYDDNGTILDVRVPERLKDQFAGFSR